MTKRKIFKLEIYSFNPNVRSETRYIECKDWSEAREIKDMLLKGRPYFSLTEETTVVR